MNEHLSQDASAAHTEDTSGLEELKQAMDEINRLSIEPHPEPDSSVEEKEDSEQKKVIDESEGNTEDANDIDQEESIEAEEAPDKEAEIKPKSDTKKQKEKKFWKERREKYKVLAERDKLAAELEELRAQRDKALEVGNYHYGQNAYADLEKAKILHKKAIEEGDTDAYTDANIALVRAASAVDEIERWNAQAKAQNNTQDNIQNSQHNTHNISLTQQEMAKDWLESHPELNPASRNYDAALAQKVGHYINSLDRNIAGSGQSEHYFSDSYFEAIDNHIDNLRRPPVKTNTPPASVDNVAGVKKSYQSHGSSQGRNTQKIILTADEKRMASNAGISEEDWLKYKIEDLNKQKKRA